MTTPAIHQLTHDELGARPGVAVTATAFGTDDAFVIVAVNGPVATVLQLFGPEPARTALVAHVRALPGVRDVVITPNAVGPWQEVVCERVRATGSVAHAAKAARVTTKLVEEREAADATFAAALAAARAAFTADQQTRWLAWAPSPIRLN